jgi:hypothetical protein
VLSTTLDSFKVNHCVLRLSRGRAFVGWFVLAMAATLRLSILFLYPRFILFHLVSLHLRTGRAMMQTATFRKIHRFHRGACFQCSIPTAGAFLLRLSMSTSRELQVTSVASASDASKPDFRIFYNDVYEVHLPDGHRFPMEKYRQVRERVQKTISGLVPEERGKVNCGMLQETFASS